MNQKSNFFQTPPKHRHRRTHAHTRSLLCTVCHLSSNQAAAPHHLKFINGTTV